MLARVMVQSVRFLALVLGSWHSPVLRFIIVPAMGLMGALAGLLADPVGGLVVGVLIGIGWGLLVAWMAAWLNWREG